jgi:hypothetical protein
MKAKRYESSFLNDDWFSDPTNIRLSSQCQENIDNKMQGGLFTVSLIRIRNRNLPAVQ